MIGAPQVWGPTLATAGQGIKIGIIDDGVDQTHPFFSPAGFTMPAGFPKGQTGLHDGEGDRRARLPASGRDWPYAEAPFDPKESEHGTHVAGIAAGDHDTTARHGRQGLRASRHAPTSATTRCSARSHTGLGLDGNSPEIAAAIEQAVKDGMDVINLSLGEPEIDASRDIVVQAIERRGGRPASSRRSRRATTSTPFGTARSARPATAAEGDHGRRGEQAGVIAYFSSGGPTPVSLLLKPDVTAPGVEHPLVGASHDGLWTHFNGTSMAAPHVAGGSRRCCCSGTRNGRRPRFGPRWSDGNRRDDTRGREVPPTREGGGMIWMPAADQPLLFGRPTSLSFGLLSRGTTRALRLSLADAGGGAGAWQVSLRQLVRARGVSLRVPASVTVPGRLMLRAVVSKRARPNEATGFVVLTRGSATRRFPYWLRVASTRLATEGHTLLRRPGVYRGNTRGRPARVSSYRYPSAPGGLGVTRRLPGPEQVFRFRIRGRVANAGAVVLSGSVSPRLVQAGSEDRLAGYTALPIRLNPYQPSFFGLEPAVGVFRPAPGLYDLVFDTRSRRAAGPFRFRFWVNDVTPPSVRLLTRSVRPGGKVVLRVTDRGSGVDWPALLATVDGRPRRVVYSPGANRAEVPVGALSRGRHTLVLTASDVQETKNNENGATTLPNTRRLGTTFSIR